MAPRSKAKSKKATKGKVRSRGTVATLPPQRRRRMGDNSGAAGLDEADIEKWHNRLNKARKEHQKAVDEARTLASTYRDERKAAKKVKFNLEAYDINVKLAEQDQGDVQRNFADAHRYQEVTASPLFQLNLFASVVPPPVPELDPVKDGFEAGKRGDPIDNCPFQPGTDKFVAWRDNWELGQQKVREGVSA